MFKNVEPKDWMMDALFLHFTDQCQPVRQTRYLVL
jgi:hypothetical protein